MSIRQSWQDKNFLRNADATGKVVCQFFNFALPFFDRLPSDQMIFLLFSSIRVIRILKVFSEVLYINREKTTIRTSIDGANACGGKNDSKFL